MELVLSSAGGIGIVLTATATATWRLRKHRAGASPKETMRREVLLVVRAAVRAVARAIALATVRPTLKWLAARRAISRPEGAAIERQLVADLGLVLTDSAHLPSELPAADEDGPPPQGDDLTEGTAKVRAT